MYLGTRPAMLIRCSKHGRVEGPFCQICRAERYLAKVKAGKIVPKKCFESEEIDSKLSVLQIRYRAFKERNKREDAKIGKDVYPWQRIVRLPREIRMDFFRRKYRD